MIVKYYKRLVFFWFCRIMLKFENSLVFLIRNKIFIKFQTIIRASDNILPFWNVCNFSLKNFSLNSLYLNFLFNYIPCIYNNLEGINFCIIFNKQFTLIISWYFSSKLKFKACGLWIHHINCKILIINSIL